MNSRGLDLFFQTLGGLPPAGTERTDPLAAREPLRPRLAGPTCTRCHTRPRPLDAVMCDPCERGLDDDAEAW